MKDYFQKIHPVDDEILDEYLAAWTPVEFPRKSIITSAGETERYLYFVHEGIQKAYYIYGDKIHVMAFTYPPSISGIPESFLTQTPSKYYLECLTDSRMQRISFRRHQELMRRFRPIETLFRKGTEKLLIGVLERHYELLAYDIETRFRSFTARSPHLLTMVPHKDLASYLRIDPTNFSKLLGRIKL